MAEYLKLLVCALLAWIFVYGILDRVCQCIERCTKSKYTSQFESNNGDVYCINEPIGNSEQNGKEKK